MSKVLLHELGRSLSYGRLSLLAKVLWPMLLASTDDQGRGTAEPDAIKWYVCPNVPEITLDKVPDLLREMVDLGMIVVYETVRGQAYQVFRWWEYQQLQWARPSKYPPPEGWTDRIRYSNRGDYYATGWETTGGFYAIPREQPTPKDDGTPPREPPRTPDGDQVDDQLNSIKPNSDQSNPTEPNPTSLNGAAAPAPVDNSAPPPPVDDDASPLQELLDAGMTKTRAKTVVKTRTPKRIHDWVVQVLADPKISNPGGYLWTVLGEGDDDPPPPRAPPNAAPDARSYIEGEYGDLIHYKEA